MKITDIITGRFIEHDFLKKRAIVIIVVASIVVLNMFFMFLSHQLYRELTFQQKEFQVINAKHSAVNAEKIRITRESYLIDLLSKKNIRLERSNQPPIKIE